MEEVVAITSSGAESLRSLKGGRYQLYVDSKMFKVEYKFV